MSPSSAVGWSGSPLVSVRDRAQPRPERVGVALRERAQQPVARDRHPAAQRVGAERRDQAALVDVAPQPAREVVGDPAQRAGEQHALALAGQPGARRGQRQVGRDVVVDLLLVQEGEQRGDVVGEARGQAALQEPRVGGGAAVVERVRPAVAVVVERVAAEPGRRGQDDEDRRAVGGLDRERDRGRAAGGLGLEDVDARRAAGHGDLEPAAGLAPALHPRGALADAEDAPAERAPARVDRERRLLAGRHRVGRRLGQQPAHAHPGLPAGRAGLDRRGPADVAGLVADEGDDLVGPGRRRRAVRRPVPLALAHAGRQRERGHLLRLGEVRAVDADPRRQPPRGHQHAERDPSRDRPGDPVGAVGPADLDRRPWRGQVEVDARAERDRAIAAAQADADAVVALGRVGAVVRGPVPGQAQRLLRRRGDRRGEPLHLGPEVVHHRDGHVVVAPDPQPDPRDVAAPVVVRREVLRDAAQVRDGRRALEPLRDEERREGRDDQQDEDGAREKAHRRRLRAPGRPRPARRRSPPGPPRRSRSRAPRPGRSTAAWRSRGRSCGSRPRSTRRTARSSGRACSSR